MKKKFTLIELIIVIVVIGLLAAMALPKATGVVQNARISAMINDKEVLEKVMLLHYQKYDDLPLLNEDQDFIVLDNNISLTKLVKAQNDDMSTIYTSLQETLKYYNDNEEYIYRIDISRINSELGKNLKYGMRKQDKDFYVYSIKTNNVYYYNTMLNGDNEIQHDEFNTTLKESELVNKIKSFTLNEDGMPVNNKPIVSLTTDLEMINSSTNIKWEYIYTDEDEEPTKISFILNNTEYTDFNTIPTKLSKGIYILKLKMQDSKGLWSDEIEREFEVGEEKILFSKENINIKTTEDVKTYFNFSCEHHKSNSGYVQDEKGRKIVAAKCSFRFVEQYIYYIDGVRYKKSSDNGSIIEVNPTYKLSYSMTSTDFSSGSIGISMLRVVTNEGWVNNEIISEDIKLDSNNTRLLLTTTEDLPEGSSLEYYIVDKDTGTETKIIKNEIIKIQNSTNIYIKIVGTKGLNNKLPSISNLELKSV